MQGQLLFKGSYCSRVDSMQRQVLFKGSFYAKAGTIEKIQWPLPYKQNVIHYLHLGLFSLPELIENPKLCLLFCGCCRETKGPIASLQMLSIERDLSSRMIDLGKENSGMGSSFRLESEPCLLSCEVEPCGEEWVGRKDGGDCRCSGGNWFKLGVEPWRKSNELVEDANRCKATGSRELRRCKLGSDLIRDVFTCCKLDLRFMSMEWAQ